MPFAPFTGVNHHYHSILFGFALICNEKEETFEWVFNTWLEAMDGKAPITIITDQDIAMGNAIRKVFPNTHHHLCTWHIGQKYPIKLGAMFHDKAFKHDFDQCIKYSLTIQVFEERWKTMVEKYSLQSHEWLSDQYNVREQWVPAYTRRYFSAGMNTTQRSEGMNGFFDNYVSSCTGLKDFILKSEEALEKQFFRERKEDYDTKYYSRMLIHKASMEQHGSIIYTKNIFKRFQDEMSNVRQFSCEKCKESSTDTIKVYTVTNTWQGAKDRRFFSVVHWRDIDVYRCSCQMYESSGMVCRHLLRYLELRSVSEIPKSLICKRWTREANLVDGMQPYNFPKSAAETASTQSMRYNHLCQLYMSLSLEASMTTQGYEHALQNCQQERAELAALPPEDIHVTQDIGNTEPYVGHTTEREDDMETGGQIPMDPQVAQTKGRRKEKRLKSGIEMASTSKPLRKCKICNKHTNHDSRNHYKVLGITPP